MAIPWKWRASGYAFTGSMRRKAAKYASSTASDGNAVKTRSNENGGPSQYGLPRLRQRVPRAPARTMARQVALFGQRFDVVFNRIATRPNCLGGLADGHAPMIVGNLQYLYR